MVKKTRLCDLMHDLTAEMVDKGIYWHEAVAQFEKQFIESALARNQGNLIKTAGAIGIHRNTLARKIAQYKISREKSPAR